MSAPILIREATTAEKAAGYEGGVKGRLAFDAGSRRMIVTDRSDENDDRELHCGDCFQLRLECCMGRWFNVRIECSMNEWILVGLPAHFRSKALCYVGAQAALYP